MNGQVIKFGTFVVTNHVFYQTAKSYGLVNIKPILPGHVLVCPRRVVPRLSGLSAEEAQDFYAAVHKVSRVVEEYYHADALNIAIQDGPLAGQSVPHVHCHIIPRKLNDLPNMDDIYKLLEGREGDLEYVFNIVKANGAHTSVTVDNEARMPRTIDEMVKEARELAEFIESKGEI